MAEMFGLLQASIHNINNKLKFYMCTDLLIFQLKVKKCYTNALVQQNQTKIRYLQIILSTNTTFFWLL